MRTVYCLTNVIDNSNTNVKAQTNTILTCYLNSNVDSSTRNAEVA